MKPTFSLLTILIFCTCNNPKTIDKPLKIDSSQTNLQRVNRIHIIMGGHEIEGYTHYLTIANYDDNADNFLVDIADKYRDTCTYYLPVWNITFCRPFDFKPHFDSRDDEPLRKHCIVTIGYNEETLHKKYPEISSITFYNNGKTTYVQTMTLDRMKNAGFYDSNGAYKRDWIKQFDAKFKTHFSDTANHQNSRSQK